MTRRAILIAAPIAVAVLTATLLAQRQEVAVNDTQVFPESVTSTRDGAVIFGSTAKPVVYRAAPGAASADAWIQPPTGGLQRVLGVFADDRAHALWVCSSAVAATPGATPTGETAVKRFDLTTGAFQSSHAFAGGTGTCNDMAVAQDGTLYATDTSGARVLRLTPGATAMEQWAADPSLASADGIAVLGDGAIYVNTFRSGTLVRLRVGADGASLPPETLATSRPLVRPDGMRSVGPNTMLLVEGEGRLDEVTIQGSRAEIRTLKDGFSGPTAVTLIGAQAFVLEAKLNYRSDPQLRGQDPGPFRVIAVAYSAPR